MGDGYGWWGMGFGIGRCWCVAEGVSCGGLEGGVGGWGLEVGNGVAVMEHGLDWGVGFCGVGVLRSGNPGVSPSHIDSICFGFLSRRYTTYVVALLQLWKWRFYSDIHDRRGLGLWIFFYCQRQGIMRAVSATINIWKFGNKLQIESFWLTEAWSFSYCCRREMISLPAWKRSDTSTG